MRKIGEILQRYFVDYVQKYCAKFRKNRWSRFKVLNTFTLTTYSASSWKNYEEIWKNPTRNEKVPFIRNSSSYREHTHKYFKMTIFNNFLIKPIQKNSLSCSQYHKLKIPIVHYRTRENSETKSEFIDQL